MVYSNAEDKTLGTWREQEASQCVSYSDKPQGIGFTSTAIRYQPFRTNRASWQGSGFPSGFGGSTAGGIVIQLIEESREQLDYHVKEVEKLTERLQGLEALQQQLIEKTNE